MTVPSRILYRRPIWLGRGRDKWWYAIVWLDGGWFLWIWNRDGESESLSPFRKDLEDALETWDRFVEEEVETW